MQVRGKSSIAQAHLSLLLLRLLLLRLGGSLLAVGLSGLLSRLLALSLEVLVINGKSLLDLDVKSVIILEAKTNWSVLCSKDQRMRSQNLQVDQLSVVHLEEHAGDLASKSGLNGLDLGEEVLANDLLLGLGVLSGSELSLEERASAEVGRSAGDGGGTTAGSHEVGVAARSATAATVLGTTGRGVAGNGRGALETLGNTGGDALRAPASGTATATTKSTNLAHGSHVLRGVRRESTRTELVDGVAHGGHLLGRDATAATLLVRVLARATTLNGETTLGEGNATTARGGHETGLLASVVDRSLHVLLGHTSLGSGLLHAELVASLDAGLELALADILALGKSDIEGLAIDHALVHLSDGLGGVIGVAEADEAEALALAELAVTLLLGLLLSRTLLLLLLLGLALLLVLLVLLILLLALDERIAHDLGGGDGAILGEHGTELLIIDIITEVLDVQVDTLVLVGLLEAGSLVRPAELLLALVLLLGTTDVEVLATEVLAVEIINSLGSSLVGGEVDETEATGLALLVAGKGGRSDLTELLEELTELVVGDLVVNVLDINVGEVGLHLLELALAVLLGNVVADVDLLLVQKHAVDVLDGLGSSLIGLVVDETVALGVTVLVLGNLARKDVAEGSEGVVKSLVVNGSIEVLDEDVAGTGLAEGGVTLGPHDAARASLDEGVVELLKSLLAISGGVVVDVGVAEGATGDSIAADTDGSDGADLGEELEEHGLGDGGVKLADIEGGGSLRVRGGSGGGSSLSTLGLALSGGDGGVDGGRGSGLVLEAGVAEVSGELVDSGVGSGSHFCWLNCRFCMMDGTVSVCVCVWLLVKSRRGN